MSALKGLRILDLTVTLPGPYCTGLLADLGAEVIKIENPQGGDWFRNETPAVKGVGIRFLNLNRNKKSLTLNLKSPKAVEIFLSLAQKSHVVLEGFRPGVVDRLGIGYGRVSSANPKIVYCSISGYGQDGPYRLLAGHDINYMGYSGLLNLSGFGDRHPVMPAMPIADYSGGLLAAVGIFAALQFVQRTGKGQYVDISMLDGLLGFQHAPLANYVATGNPPQRGKFWLAANLPWYSVYETKDGKAVTMGPLEPHFWANFCRLLGREDLIECQDAGDEKKQEEIHHFLRDIFRQKTRDAWMEFFKDRDVCVGPVQEVDEVLNDQQVRHRQMIVEVEHPQAGRLPQIGIPIKFSETPGEIREPAPALGQHNKEILQELGFSLSGIETLKDEKVI